MSKKLIFIDCDSTLSAIEGIDELARLRGEATFQACVDMTNRAMDGEIALEAVYGERLKLIAPSLEESLAIGQQYIDAVEPKALELVQWLKSHAWLPVIISGGITQVIEPFAAFLEIDRLEAVPLVFDETGTYAGFVETAPTARMGGKIEIIDRFKTEFKPDALVMVGDGSSDLETKEHVDLFIGYGGFVTREKVKAEADVFVQSLSEIPSILDAM